MTYYGSEDLARRFRQVRSNTIQAAEEIPEGHYSFKASPEARSKVSSNPISPDHANNSNPSNPPRGGG